MAKVTSKNGTTDTVKLKELCKEPSQIFVNFMTRLIMEEKEVKEGDMHQKQVHFSTNIDIKTADQTPQKTKEDLQTLGINKAQS